MVAENQVTSAYIRVRHPDFTVVCIHTGYTFRCISIADIQVMAATMHND